MSKARNFKSGFWYWDGVPWFGHRVLWSRWRWHGSMPPLSLLEAARDGHVVDYLRRTVGPDLWYVLSVLFFYPLVFFCICLNYFIFANNSCKYHCILSFCWLFQVPFLGQNREWPYTIQKSMVKSYWLGYILLYKDRIFFWVFLTFIHIFFSLNQM